MLNKRRLLAFQMKLDGKTYSDIAKETGYSKGSLEVYLREKGRWGREYAIWSKRELSLITDDTRRTMRASVAKAATVLNSILNSDNYPLALKAAQDILNRNGILNLSQDTKEEDIAERIFRFYESRNGKNTQAT